MELSQPHPSGTLYLLTFDCARAFPYLSATWKPICSDWLSPPALLQAPLYLRTSRRYRNVLLLWLYLQTQFDEDRCTQFRVIVITDPQTQPQTHKQTRPITIHCAAASAQCNRNLTTVSELISYTRLFKVDSSFLASAANIWHSWPVLLELLTFKKLVLPGCFYAAFSFQYWHDIGLLKSSVGGIENYLDSSETADSMSNAAGTCTHSLFAELGSNVIACN